MKWLASGWLWLIVFLPLIYLLFRYFNQLKRRRFETFALPSVWKAIVPELNWTAGLIKIRFWLLGMAFALVALAGPQWGAHEKTVKVQGLDILFVVDVSNSMNVEDIVPTRLKKTKHVIQTIVSQLQGDRAGLVAFAGSTYLASPLTTDLDFFMETVQVLDPEIVLNQGTDLGLALETAAKAIDRGAQDPNDPEASENRNLSSKVVVLISDGEDLEASADDGVARLKELGARVFILGVGTEKGGQIPVRDDYGVLRGYKNDRRGSPVTSKADFAYLQKLAGQLSGKYWTVTDSEDELQDLMGDLRGMNRSDYAERKFLVYENHYQIPLLLAILCFLIELFLPARKLFGGVAAIFLIFGLLSAPARADSSPGLGVYQKNKMGLEAYQKGDLKEAEKNFSDAQARDPLRPELMYNQSLIQMDKGDAAGALQGFDIASKEAVSRKNPKVAARSFYNLGEALSQSGKTDEAIQSYSEAIRQAEEAKDQEVIDGARKKIQMIAQMMQKQQQQKSGQGNSGEDQEKKNQSQEEKNQSQAGQDQNDQKNKGQSQSEDQKYKDTPESMRKNQFQSKSLTKEDAERVMAELSNKDKDLQNKLKRQKGKRAYNGRDW